MLNNRFPTDIIGYFIGDITLMDNYIQLYKENLGIFKVKVYCPTDIKHPLLPVRYKNKTIYPTGEWIGTYFSEELKAVSKLNIRYTFYIIEAHSYSRVKLFNSFVVHFFAIKKDAKGVARFLAKLCLNSLYGMFYSSKGES